MASARRIQLIRTPQSVYNPYVSLAMRFTVDAVNAYLMENEIFKMFRAPLDPNDPDSTTRNHFISVCSPGDMANLGINNPPINDPAANFRVNHIDLTFETETVADDAWTAIVAAATDLKNGLDASDSLGTPVTVWIGTPP